ncbi:MAG: WYL domain-containing protein [Planctomycetota bacterium]|nr:MAG: WYL domain-containing protein [Planctomycetota bacterium]
MSNPVPRLRRLLSIIPLIRRRGGVSLEELQKRLGVSKRELQGDLDAIMLCGVPPYLPNDYISVFIDGDRVTVDYADHFARPASLTLQEALALRLALTRLPVPDEGELFEAHVELLDSLDKLIGGENLSSLEGRIDAPKFQPIEERLRIIDDAVRDRRRVEIDYYSPSSERVGKRTIRPYGRGDRFGNQYLVAYCERAGALRSFRIDRIADIAPLAEGPSFERPEDFDLQRALDDIGPKRGEVKPVRLRFHKDIADHVRARFGGTSARIEPTPGGDLVVELHAGSLPWAVSQALLYGELVELLEPEEGRRQLASRLRQLLDEPEEG